MASELHVELDRLRELATIFDGTVRGVTVITTNETTPAVTASLNGSATSGACHAATGTAHIALNAVADHYKALHKGTHTSADTYESTDTEHARTIDALRKSL